MLSTHPLIGHADDSGVAADHQEDEAEQRHVPSAKHKTQAGSKTTPNEQCYENIISVVLSVMAVFLWPPCSQEEEQEDKRIYKMKKKHRM